MKELKKYGFRYCKPEKYRINIWYNKDTDMEVIKYSKKDLIDMDVDHNLYYEVVHNRFNGISYVELFATIEEVIDYIKD